MRILQDVQSAAFNQATKDCGVCINPPHGQCKQASGSRIGCSGNRLTSKDVASTSDPTSFRTGVAKYAKGKVNTHTHTHTSVAFPPIVSQRSAS